MDLCGKSFAEIIFGQDFGFFSFSKGTGEFSPQWGSHSENKRNDFGTLDKHNKSVGVPRPSFFEAFFSFRTWHFLCISGEVEGKELLRVRGLRPWGQCSLSSFFLFSSFILRRQRWTPKVPAAAKPTHNPFAKPLNETSGTQKGGKKTVELCKVDVYADIPKSAWEILKPQVNFKTHPPLWPRRKADSRHEERCPRGTKKGLSILIPR